MTKILKHCSLLFLMLTLGACSQSDDGNEPVAAGTETDVQAVSESESDVPEVAAPETEDEPVSVVEESAAEPEAEEQAIVLAQADTKPQQQKFKYEEGKHFTRLVPTQPTVGGADKIEVAEFFWYGCPHCYDLEPYLQRWKTQMPANVRFVQVPVTWNNAVAAHAKLFYAADALGNMGVIEDMTGFHQAVFSELHERGNRLLSERSMKQLFARFGASEEDFDKAWNSFDVDRRLRLAEDLSRRYAVQSVPTIVVNGKFRTGAPEAGGNAELIEVIDELIARESVR